MSFSWGILYMTFAAVPLVFGVSHGFNVQQAGAVFAGRLLSSVLMNSLYLRQRLSPLSELGCSSWTLTTVC